MRWLVIHNMLDSQQEKLVESLLNVSYNNDNDSRIKVLSDIAVSLIESYNKDLSKLRRTYEQSLYIVLSSLKDELKNTWIVIIYVNAPLAQLVRAAAL